MARRNTASSLSLSYPDLTELRQQFRNFPKSMAARYMEPAMKKAIRPGVSRLRQITPRGPTGNLKKSVKPKTKRYPKDGTAIGLVGYTVGGGSKGYHQGFLEFGTKQRFTKGRVASSLRSPKGDPRGQFTIVNKYSKTRQARNTGRRADRAAARATRLFASSLGTSSRARELAGKVVGLRAKQGALQAAGRKLTTRPRPPRAFFKSAATGERVDLGRMPVGGRTRNPPVKTAFEASRAEMIGILREQLAVQLELAARDKLVKAVKRDRRRAL